MGSYKKDRTKRVAPLFQAIGVKRMVAPGVIVYVTAENKDGDIFSCFGTVANSALATLAGFAKSCQYVKTDKSGAATYENTGGKTSATFTLMAGGGGGGFTQADFTGEAMGNHSHTFNGSALATHAHAVQTVDETINAAANNRLALDVVTGTLHVGDTLVQATSLATATVRTVVTTGGFHYIDVNTVTGTFDSTNVVTASGGATFIPKSPLLSVYTATGTPVLTSGSGYDQTGNFLLVSPFGGQLSTPEEGGGGGPFIVALLPGSKDFVGQAAGAVTSITVSYLIAATTAISAGTPAGTTAGNTAGTPAGTIVLS